METNDLKKTENVEVQEMTDTKESPTVVEASDKNENKADETPSSTTKEDETGDSKKESTSDGDSESGESTNPENDDKDEDDKEEDEKDVLSLNHLDVDFAFDLLSVPTYSRHEYRMVTFIILWARAHKIKYEFDEKGNVYLTKGTLKEGEFYPCVTSHLDTVQTQQEAYAQCGVELQLKERKTAKGHELYVEDTGIGADDKAGILISLSLFDHFDKIKACFFLEEEIGCKGSEKLNKEWFNDVAYVIGWDSPERNRAAYACSSELLMSKDFFLKIKETCKENGVTIFNSEPYTDVKEIRKQTGLMCMNFGNGGWNAHQSSEYVVLEEIDGAIGLGIALIKLLGNKERFTMPSKSVYAYYSKDTDEDVEYFDSLYKKAYTNYNYNYYGSRYGQNGSSASKGSSATNTTNNSSNSKKDASSTDANKFEPQVIDYIVERYEKHIENIRGKCEERDDQILRALKELIEKGNGKISYQDVVNIFDENLSSEPFSTAIEF